jgi:hypothetical protein
VDFGVYFRVLWRFRLLVAAGLALAFLAALLSFVRVGFDGGVPTFSYRTPDVWRSASTILVTQEGFPYGRAILDELIQAEGSDEKDATLVPRFGDAGRYSGLAELYTELAKSDAVQAEVLAGAPPGSRYEPQAATTPSGTVLPLIHMVGYGTTPEAAEAVAEHAMEAFRAYLAREQAENNIPSDRRVEVVPTRQASAAELFEPRSTIRPIIIFLGITMVFVALAFVLENIRPQTPLAPKVEPVEHPASVRRSA